MRLLFSRSVVWPFMNPRTAAWQLSCPSSSHGVCWNSCPLSLWCHPTISSSVISPFFCLQSFLASGSLPMSWLFTSCDQNIGASASTWVLPMNTRGWFPLGLTALISFQSKGLSRVFFNTTVQRYQFFHAQPFSWSSSHIHTWLWVLGSRISFQIVFG